MSRGRRGQAGEDGSGGTLVTLRGREIDTRKSAFHLLRAAYTYV